MLYSLGLVLIAGGLLYHFFALRIFNLLVLGDAGVEVAARGVAFGGDPAQRLDVYRPAGRPGPLPVVLFVHGGSWSSGSRRDYGFAGRAFAAQGYVTMVAGYRLGPRHVFPDFVSDAALAVAFAAREAAAFGGDGSRIFLAGHSAGAYNLAQAVLDPRFFAAAGVDPAAVRAMALLAGPYDFLPLDTDATRKAFGAAPDLAATQPVNFARHDAPPMLLLTGTQDKTVYPRNSRKLAERLQAAGAAAVFKEYPQATHVSILLALARPFRARTPVLEDMIAFFRAHGG